MVEFKTLEVLLNEYIDLAAGDIVKALSFALGVEMDKARQIYDIVHEAGLEVETQVVGILDDKTTSYNDRTEQLIKFLKDNDLFDSATYEDAFNYVDLEKDYSYRCSVKNDQLRDSVMDWLEENKYEYLIDTKGNFAVQCLTREDEYKVSRKIQHIIDTWDKPDYGTNVDKNDSLVSDVLNDDEIVESPKKKTNKDLSKMAATSPNPATELSSKKFQQKVIPNKKKAMTNDRKKQKTNTKLDEGVMGMTAVTPIARMRTLAGLPPTQESEEIENSNNDAEYSSYRNPKLEGQDDEFMNVFLSEDNLYCGKTDSYELPYQPLESLMTKLHALNYTDHVTGKELTQEIEGE